MNGMGGHEKGNEISAPSRCVHFSHLIRILLTGLGSLQQILKKKTITNISWCGNDMTEQKTGLLF
jgi:hypothetical protein